MPVPAFISAPMPSKIWSISVDLKRSVPLKSRCSRKWEIPACSGVSSREPTRTQKPSATERTDGIRSVTTRSPESSSVTRVRSSVVGSGRVVGPTATARRAVVASAAAAAAVPVAAAA